MRCALSLLLAFALFSARGYAEEVVEIPLSEIWAFNMPGTKDIHGLGFGEPQPMANVGWGSVEYQESREAAINEMIRGLSNKLPSEDAQTGFVVASTPSVPVLRKLADVVGAGSKYQKYGQFKEYPQGSDITLVFYSHPSSYNIQVKEVVRDGYKITVNYKVVPQRTPESNVNFALIPFKDLPAGEYQVEFNQLQMDKEYFEAGYIPFLPAHQKRLVSNNFSFKIWKPVEPDTTEPSKDAIEIPLASIWGLNMPGMRNLRELEMEDENGRHDTIRAISKVLMVSKIGQKAGRGFAVKGSAEEAFAAIKNIMTGMMEPSHVFSTMDHINLCVFAKTVGYGARLNKVLRDGRQVRIEYYFGPRDERGVELKFIMVPLGRLEKGRYSVEMIMRLQPPGAEKPAKGVSQDFVDRYLSQDFSFSVQ